MNVFKEMKKQKRQKSRISITLHPVCPPPVLPSFSATSSASATRDSKTNPSLPTQHEDKGDEDLHDDPLPLMNSKSSSCCIVNNLFCCVCVFMWKSNNSTARTA